MNILAVDTALSACSVAILAGDRAIVRSVAMPRGHAEALMPMLAGALAESGLGYGDIDRFVVTTGPGTFTGVRVGVAAVRGFALTTGRPAVGVTTLEALAATARLRPEGAGRPVLVAMDARRDEVYAQGFNADGAPLTEPMVIAIDALLGRIPGDIGLVFGSAAEAVSAASGSSGRDLKVLGTESAPDPVALARLGLDRTPDSMPKPLYLRAPDAKPQAGAALARK
jgi:tRNA threonylcarbamoyladenosine biosynthesis protein TsaB